MYVSTKSLNPTPYNVYLNDELVHFAVAADDVNGWVEEVINDGEVAIIFGRENNLKVRTKVKHGIVKIEEIGSEE